MHETINRIELILALHPRPAAHWDALEYATQCYSLRSALEAWHAGLVADLDEYLTAAHQHLAAAREMEQQDHALRAAGLPRQE